MLRLIGLATVIYFSFVFGIAQMILHLGARVMNSLAGI